MNTDDSITVIIIFLGQLNAPTEPAQLLSRLESGDIQGHWEDDEFVFHKEFSPVA